MKTLGITLVLATAMTWAAAALAQIHVVVSASNPRDSISKEELKRIYLGKQTVWKKGQGGHIEPLRLPGDSDVTTRFLKDVVEKSTEEFTAYWRRKLFSGHGVPPRVLKDDAQILTFVREHEEAIGFTASKAPREGIRYIPVTD